MRGKTLIAAMAVLVLPAGVVAKGAVSSAITQALADPARADQADQDARRQAAEMIAFAGIKPGQSVIDWWPGSGYWTRIFTGVVGPAGHVDAVWPQLAAKYSEKALPALQARGLANVTARVDAGYVSASKPVDVIWTVENYHDVPNGGRGEAAIAAFNAEAFRALKPGGVFLVVDHVAPAGSGLADTDTLHRIDPAIVRKQVEAAGFKFAGESKVLANGQDSHTLKVFDPAIRGHTDQFIYKFRKPA